MEWNLVCKIGGLKGGVENSPSLLDKGAKDCIRLNAMVYLHGHLC